MCSLLSSSYENALHVPTFFQSVPISYVLLLLKLKSLPGKQTLTQTNHKLCL